MNGEMVFHLASPYADIRYRGKEGYSPILVTAGGVHCALTAASSGQYVRSTRLNLPVGAGSQLSCLSLVGGSCWIKLSTEPSAFVVITKIAGQRYLVSILGPQSDWVKNVEAAHGEAVLHHGSRLRIHLEPVHSDSRAVILREYVRIASSGRQHFPLPPGAPLSQFEAIADRYPVNQISRSTREERP
jgi:hypothetical protein